MMVVNRVLEGIDLSGVFTLLALAGALMSVYVMQKTRYEAEDRKDPAIVRHLYTGGLGLLALAMLWNLSYSVTRDWQPWPPQVLMMLAFDLLLAVRAAAISIRLRREGRYFGAPSAADERRQREMTRR